MIRNISCNELLYTDMQDISNSYVIQFIMKIKLKQNKNILENSINEVVKNNFGTNLLLKGNKYYLVAEKVKLLEIEDNSDDLYNIDLFSSKIDYKKESAQFILLKNKDDLYFVTRFLHSVMDGKGCLTFVENLVNFLNGEKMLECSNMTNEEEFIENLDTYKKSESKIPKYTNKNSLINYNYQTKWRIIDIPNYSSSIIAKISKVLKSEFLNDEVRFMIPTDIRRHNRNDNFLGNLTLPIFLNVKGTDTIQSINGQLLYKLKEKKELNRANVSYYFYKNIPRIVRKSCLNGLMKFTGKINKFSIGANISFLGRIDLNKYNNKCFDVEDFVSLPVHQPLGAFSMVIVEYNEITKLCFSYFKNQFKEEYIDSVIQNIKSELTNDIYVINNTQKKYDYNFVDLLNQSFDKNANEVAVVDGNCEYSYNDLKKNILKYKYILNKYKIKNGEEVAIYLKRGFEYISCFLACLSSNITYIPIDKTTNQQRIQSILASSKYKLFISDENVEIKKGINILNEKIESTKNIKIRNMFNFCKNDIIYKIYTSGTTGIPKCVPITYFNLNNYLLWIRNTTKTDIKKVMPLFTSLSVDLTITSSYLPLLDGGIIKTYSEQFSSNTIKKIFSDTEINIIKCTPTHLSFICDCKFDNSKLYKDYIIVGGEKLTSTTCDNILKIVKNNVKIINEYGPAEATVGCVYSIYDKKYVDNVAIGIPIDNTKILIWNNNKIVTTNNQRGELLISGDSVFNGYISKNKTNEFVNINNTKYYKTGDVVYFDNGELYYCDRSDNQVKIRGQRVELDEIKRELDKTIQLDDSILIWDNNIYAYVISKNKINEEEIKSKLRKKFPNYMIPYEIIRVNKFPLGTNGKIDKKELLKLNKKKNDAYDYEDKILSMLESIKPGLKIEKDKTMFEIGFESFDVINFLQKVSNEYIKPEKEDEFFEIVMEQIDKITIIELEKIIIQFGGKL